MFGPELIRGLAAEVLPMVTDLRRAIHRHPELAHQEYRTTEAIVETLRGRGLSPRTRTPRTGLTVEIGSGKPLVALRADLDGLPIQEPEGLPFRSEVEGVMHACGHDAHAAIGVGVGLVLSRLGPLPGRVRIIFQPAEETFPGGAQELVREGVIDGVSAIIAFHVDPTLEPGRIGFRAGPITGSADRFYITLEGPGGHTARPHRTVDLIHAAGVVITQLPGTLDRLVDARKPFSLVFGKISGGTADNVIPATVELSGTCRTLDREVYEELPVLIESLVQDLVAPAGAKALVHYQRGIPPVVNDESLIAGLRAAVADVIGQEALASTNTSMGAEDFARYTEQIPGALLRLGARPAGFVGDLHSAGFRIDERALETGLTAGVAALLRMLEVPTVR
jgi:amidohydrolase